MKRPARRKALFLSSEIIRQGRADGFAGLFRLKLSASFPVLFAAALPPAEKKLYSKPACGYFRGSELLFAGRLTALRPAGLEGRSEVMGLNKWLFDTVAAPYIDKAAEQAHAKFESDRELLRKDIGKIEKLLDRDRTSLKELLDRDRTSLNELLDRDRTSINEKIGNIDKQFETIDKQLSNHITETNKKIDKLAERVSELEVKNAERHAELYKLLSSKSPDKKQ